MGFLIADRVQETTATTGTGTITLAGAVTQYQSFVTGIGVGNTTYYCILCGDGVSWETGLGTVGGSGPYTLARTTILSSSNSGAAISLTGTSTVFGDLPAAGVYVQTLCGVPLPPSAPAASVSAYATKGVGFTPNSNFYITGVMSPFVTVNAATYQAAVATINLSTFVVGSVLASSNVFTASSATNQNLMFTFPSAVLLVAGTSYVIAVSCTSGGATYVLPILTNSSSAVYPGLPGATPSYILRIAATSVTGGATMDNSAGTSGAYLISMQAFLP